MDNEYIINTETLAIVPINKKKSKIYENEGVFIINKSAKRIIEDNCSYFGSTYDGRKKSTSKLIGVTHKAPILIEETNELIFFPTTSPRLNDCTWIALNQIDNYQRYDECESMISFQNDAKLLVNVSNKSIENQVMRATRLGSVLRQKKKKKISNK